jgi:hypothetical protein
MGKGAALRLVVAALVFIAGGVLTLAYWALLSLGWVRGGPALTTFSDALGVYLVCVAGCGLYVFIGSFLLTCVGLDPFNDKPDP